MDSTLISRIREMYRSNKGCHSTEHRLLKYRVASVWYFNLSIVLEEEMGQVVAADERKK